MIHHPLLPLLLLLLVPGLCFGAGPPAPEDTDEIGFVHRQGPLTAVVMGDRYFLVAPETRIERSDGSVGSSTDLDAGQKVRFSYGVTEQGRLYLTRLRIISGVSKGGRSRSVFNTPGSAQ